MRPRVALVSVVAGLLASSLAPAARATDCYANHYSTCINDDVLWAHAGASRFVSIGGTDTVAPSQIAFGLLATYLSRPIILSVPNGAPPSTSDQYVVNDQVNGTFLWAYGVSERFELDLAVPVTFGQSGTGLEPITGGKPLKDTAVRDLRLGWTYALMPRTSALRIAPRLEVSAPTGDDDQFAGERTVVFVPSVSASWQMDRFFAGLELGARIRPTVQLQTARVGTQLVTALGAGYDLLARRDLLAIVAEAWALPTFAEQENVQRIPQQADIFTPNGQTMLPAEWQLSARTAPLKGGDLSIQAGGGGAIPLADATITRPRWRFTLGVRWAPREHGGKTPAEPSGAGAGGASGSDLRLSTAHDACTTEPDVVDGFGDADGCPDEDQDHDGVPDRFDKCPNAAEDFVGVTDGCPEVPPTNVGVRPGAPTEPK